MSVGLVDSNRSFLLARGEVPRQPNKNEPRDKNKGGGNSISPPNGGGSGGQNCKARWDKHFSPVARYENGSYVIPHLHDDTGVPYAEGSPHHNSVIVTSKLENVVKELENNPANTGLKNQTLQSINARINELQTLFRDCRNHLLNWQIDLVLSNINKLNGLKDRLNNLNMKMHPAKAKKSAAYWNNYTSLINNKSSFNNTLATPFMPKINAGLQKTNTWLLEHGINISELSKWVEINLNEAGELILLD